MGSFCLLERSPISLWTRTLNTMSAYALSDLFPPIEDLSATADADVAASASSVPQQEEISSYTSLGSNKDLSLPQQSMASAAPVTPQTPAGPCHELPSATSHSSGDSSNATASTSSTSGCREYELHQTHNNPNRRIPSRTAKPRPQQRHYSYANLPPLRSLDDEQEDEFQQSQAHGNNKHNNSLLGISIKDAKIDPVRWVQFLTGNGTQNQKNSTSSKKTLRRRCKDSRSGVTGSSHSPQGSPVHHKSMLQEPFGRPSTAPSSSPRSRNSPETEAIEFELSITFQSRKYTAKRTMQCIIKLRDDLIREMRARKRWLANQMPRDSDSSRSQDSIPSDHPSLQIPSLRPSGVGASVANNEDRHFEIPEIPPLTVGGMGFVGRGFSMLHAMVTSYAPVMDRWLKNVMTIVPEDSECLLNFLWEPTSDNFYHVGSILESANKESSGSMHSSSHRISMGSIKELDFEDDA